MTSTRANPSRCCISSLYIGIYVISNIPIDIAAILLELDIASFVYLADNDAAGEKGASNLRTLLHGSDWKGEGADLIEIDLHLSADGQLVVIHADTVNRTLDATGRVGDQSFSELRALDAGSWISPQFRGERIPILSDALE